MGTIALRAGLSGPVLPQVLPRPREGPKAEEPQLNNKIINPIKAINLDLSLARIATVSQALRVVFSTLTGGFYLHDPSNTKTRFWDVIDDVLQKFRQVAQWSIHAQPGYGLRKPDDISTDYVENMVTHSIGQRAYQYNAFLAPWLGVLKIFFPYGNSPIMGLPGRIVDWLDNSINKVSNIFWNLRRLGKAFVPYDGGITSKDYSEKQNQVREVWNYYWTEYILKGLGYLPFFEKFRNILPEHDPLYASNFKFGNINKERINNIAADMRKTFVNNFKAMISSTYTSPHNSMEKALGSEEPENELWYVRSKIFSKSIGLFSGAIGAVLNSAAIAINAVGSFFNIKELRETSFNLMDRANGLMSLVYITGEVPANLNQYFKESKFKKQGDWKNLLVFGIGLGAMLDRLKLVPGISHLMSLVGIKKVLDKFDKPLSHLFFLFFSANRWLLHHTEKEEALAKASSQEIFEATKHDDIKSQLLLIPRIIMGDPDVTYSQKDYDLARQLAV